MPYRQFQIPRWTQSLLTTFRQSRNCWLLRIVPCVEAGNTRMSLILSACMLVEMKISSRSLRLPEISSMISLWWWVVEQFSLSLVKPLLVSQLSMTKMLMRKCLLSLCSWTISRTRVKSQTLFATLARTVDRSHHRFRHCELVERSTQSRNSRQAVWTWAEMCSRSSRIWSRLMSRSRCLEEPSFNTENS